MSRFAKFPCEFTCDTMDLQNLTELGENPIKDLLDFYAERRGTTALDLYKLVLRDSLCAESSVQVISLLRKRSARRFYGKKKREPHFVSIRKHSTLVRLSAILRTHFVIVQLYPGRRLDPIKIVDTRTNQVVVKGRPADACDVFCLVHDGGRDVHRFFHAPLGLASVYQSGDLDVTESAFMVRADSRAEESCFLRRLASLLDVELASGAEGEEEEEAWTLMRVCSNSTRAWELLGERVVLLVYHLGSLPTKSGAFSTSRRLRFERQTFRIVGVVRNSRESRIPWNEAVVVSVTSSGRLYLMTEQISGRLMQEKVTWAKDASLGPESALPADVRERARDEERPGGKRRRADDAAELFPCSCPVCREAVRWRDNMDPVGPQLLYKIPFDVSFYLEIFGLDTESNRKVLQRCFQMSCCAMDVEAVTVNLSSDKKASEWRSTLTSSDSEEGGSDEEVTGARRGRPRETGSTAAAEFSSSQGSEADTDDDGGKSEGSFSSSSDLGSREEEEEEEGPAGAPFEPVSRVPRSEPMGQEATAIQRPLFIGHLDNLEGSEFVYFEAKGGAEGVSDMVDAYLAHLLEVQETLAARKEESLAPLLEFCDLYRRAHWEFFDAYQLEDKRVRSVWERSLLGALRAGAQEADSQHLHLQFQRVR